MLAFLEAAGTSLGVAMNAIDSIAMTLAILVTAWILAAAGGMASARGRLYGAIVGGMIMNIVVKAEGGGYVAALAAMLLTAAFAFAVGSVPFLVQLLKRVRRVQR